MADEGKTLPTAKPSNSEATTPSMADVISSKGEKKRGRVKWFNANKGYGFIQPDDGSKEVFVHISSVEKAGLRTLNENQAVSYDLDDDKGKLTAVNLKSA